MLSFSDNRNFFEFERGSGRNVQGETDNDFDTLPWNGTLVDGSSVPDGSYRLALRGLKMFATNESDPNSWDTYVTPSFTIRRLDILSTRSWRSRGKLA